MLSSPKLPRADILSIEELLDMGSGDTDALSRFAESAALDRLLTYGMKRLMHLLLDRGLD